jgi:hypothetical protein
MIDGHTRNHLVINYWRDAALGSSEFALKAKQSLFDHLIDYHDYTTPLNFSEETFEGLTHLHQGLHEK